MPKIFVSYRHTDSQAITFAEAGIMVITESVNNTILFTATEVDGSTTNEINTIKALT